MEGKDLEEALERISEMWMGKGWGDHQLTTNELKLLKWNEGMRKIAQDALKQTGKRVSRKDIGNG